MQEWIVGMGMNMKYLFPIMPSIVPAATASPAQPVHFLHINLASIHYHRRCHQSACSIVLEPYQQEKTEILLKIL